MLSARSSEARSLRVTPGGNRRISPSCALWLREGAFHVQTTASGRRRLSMTSGLSWPYAGDRWYRPCLGARQPLCRRSSRTADYGLTQSDAVLRVIQPTHGEAVDLARWNREEFQRWRSGRSSFPLLLCGRSLRRLRLQFRLSGPIGEHRQTGRQFGNFSPVHAPHSKGPDLPQAMFESR